MKCSFIVSAFDKPDQLCSLLYALKVQTEQDFEVIVCDNSPNRCNLAPVAKMGNCGAPQFRYVHTGPTCCNCYQSANLAAAEDAHGDYLCFPSCDGWYTPTFLADMLRPGVDLTYCDMLYDPRGDTQTPQRYRVIDVMPKLGCIDKGGFLIRRDKFQPFPWKEPSGEVFADGMLIERLIASGVTHAKVPGVLFAHN